MPLVPSTRSVPLLGGFELYAAEGGEEAANFGLVFEPLQLPARFVLLVLLLLAIELLLAGHESGGLLLDIFVAALDPVLQVLVAGLRRLAAAA